MRHIILFSFLVGSLLLTAAYCDMSFDCTKGNGNVKEYVRIVKGFNAAEISMSGDIVLSQGAEESLKIVTDENIEKMISTDVKDGKLFVDSKNSICPTKLQFYLTVKDLNELGINGSSDITSSGVLNLKNIKISINGSGDVTFEQLQNENLVMNVQGSGDISLQGTGNNMQIEVSGSGDIKTSNFKVHNADVSINGSGDAYIFADQVLKAGINGSGDIHYYGKPAKLNTNVSGSGDVIAE